MIIVTDKDTDAPEVPTISSYSDFRDFVQNDMNRINQYGCKQTTYYEGNYYAVSIAIPTGYACQCFEYEQIDNE